MADASAETKIPQDLLTAYENTDFRVLEPRPFTLRIGQYSSDLAEIYRDIGVSCAGYLTAWNPYSVETSDEENAQAHAMLIQELSLGGLPTLDALGVDPSGQWPGEKSVFVPGIDLERAKSLGTEFDQNAIVWAGEDAVPRLILLR